MTDNSTPDRHTAEARRLLDFWHNILSSGPRVQDWARMPNPPHAYLDAVIDSMEYEKRLEGDCGGRVDDQQKTLGEWV